MTREWERYATEAVRTDPFKEPEQVVAEGYRAELYVMFPQCLASDDCDAVRWRGYLLCHDQENERCRIAMVHTDRHQCQLGQYSLITRRRAREAGVQVNIFVLPGGSQVTDVILGCGVPRAVVGVACPPDLKEGRSKVLKAGSRPFLVPLGKTRSCYENFLRRGREGYLKNLAEALAYVQETRRRGLSLAEFLRLSQDGRKA